MRKALRKKCVFIRYNRPSRVLVTHNNRTDRFMRYVVLDSTLSAFDGRVLAYHGVNG
jgi:hypothetical protein